MINRRGFTLTELVIAVAISSIVLIIVFTFVVDTITNLSTTRSASEKITSFHDFSMQIKKYKNTYNTVSVIHNGTSTAGYDIIMLKDFTGSGWVLVWLVDPENMKLVKDNTYENYKKRVIWLRNITADNIVELQWDPNKAYDYNFYEDKIYEDLFTKDFQVELYNTGAIIEISVWIIFDEYNVNFEGQKWNAIPESNIYTRVINL